MKKRKAILALTALIVFVAIVMTIFMQKKNSSIETIEIPTISQQAEGYPRGCEGVSLYMALKGKGYVEGISLDQFMTTMPKASVESDYDPDTGYAGDPTKSLDSEENYGKRTTINPKALTEWAKKYDEKAINLEGTDAQGLLKAMKKGAPVVIWITNGWQEPEWGEWSWGKAVTNNHAVCLVGYDEKTQEYIVNDTGGDPVIGIDRIEKERFEKAYNARCYAVAIY